jgi:hypothetical protein
MRHVFGMAKSNLDFSGAKAQRAELDVLRLIYAVQHYRERGDEAQGYILVLEQVLTERIQKWLAKYQAEDTVICLCHAPNATEMGDLIAEKRANVEGMIAGVRGDIARGLSDARIGRLTAETALERMIEERERGVIRARTSAVQPLAIRWDYYGTIP